MADLGDVLDAIRDQAAAALNAEGIAQPGADSKGIRVYRGWPGEALTADIAAGIAHVTVYPRAGVTTALDGRLGEWVEAPRAPPGMTATVAGDTITLAGTADRAGLILGAVADRAAWTVQLAQGATAQAAAASLATAIAADRPAVATGAAVALDGAGTVRAGVYAGGTESFELARDAQGVLLSVWAPSAALRDRIARVLTLWIGRERGRLTAAMPDGSRATIRVEGSAWDDAGRTHPVYRRDVALVAIYSTTLVRQAPPVAVVEVGLSTVPPGPPRSWAY